jgi:phytoene dehydrogenase-like protein
MAVFRQTRPTSIGTTAYCLDEAPRYKSARHDAEIDACLKTVVGYQSPADVLEQDADIRRGRLPRPAGVVRIHSLWDESLAPGPFHLAGVDSAFPAASLLDEETWGFIDASFPSAFLETWRSHFAPGNGPQVFAMGFEHSHSFERRMLLRMGPDQYRSSINGLYLAGPGVYPGGGVHGACGRNAARTILNDFAAPRPPIREIRAG